MGQFNAEVLTARIAVAMGAISEASRHVAMSHAWVTNLQEPLAAWIGVALSALIDASAHVVVGHAGQHQMYKAHMAAG